MAIFSFLIGHSVRFGVASRASMLAFFCGIAHVSLARIGSGAAAPPWAMVLLKRIPDPSTDRDLRWVVMRRTRDVYLYLPMEVRG